MVSWRCSYDIKVGYLDIVATMGYSAGTSLGQPIWPTVLLGYGGEAVFQYQGRSWCLGAGDCLMVSGRNVGLNGGSQMVCSGGPYSVVAFHFDPQRLLQTVGLMGGRSIVGLGDELLLQNGECWLLPADPLSSSLLAMLGELIEKVDRLLDISPVFLEKLQLEDQIYRHLAGMLVPDLAHEGVFDRLRQRERQGRDAFDELIDFIKANLDQPLNLTLLESRSHYSRRALQYAFRERLGCTPTQWIRSQRLDLARQRLERPSPNDSVASIAIACGYRSLSLFSVDFQQCFHLKPSDLLREARASMAKVC
ncbi:MAG: AraC family transcriptional regulator [Cyanobium sp.]